MKNKKNPGRIIFFLSQRLVGADTYAPIAMQLKNECNSSEIIFVNNNRANQKSIEANPDLKEAIFRTGSLVSLAEITNSPFEIIRKIKKILALVALTAQKKNTHLIYYEPYDTFHMYALFIIAKIRGGRGLVVPHDRSDTRSWLRATQAKSDLLRTTRKKNLLRLIMKTWDYCFYYHDNQTGYLARCAGDSYKPELRIIKLQPPQYYPAWRAYIAERSELKIINTNKKVISIFLSKLFANRHLREKNSIEYSTDRLLEALLSIRDDIVILVRPHPMSIDTDYYKNLFKRFPGLDMKECFRDPQIMLAQSICTFTCVTTLVSTLVVEPYNMVDITDYKDEEVNSRASFLERELGIQYLSPRSNDFVAQIHRIVGSVRKHHYAEKHKVPNNVISYQSILEV